MNYVNRLSTFFTLSIFVCYLKTAVKFMDISVFDVQDYFRFPISLINTTRTLLQKLDAAFALPTNFNGFIFGNEIIHKVYEV